MRPPEPATRDDIKRLVEAGIDSSIGYLGSDIGQDRARLLDAYYGRPYGDEVDGWSAVVSRDVLETVEWTVAQLVRLFAGEDFCEFEPTGPEDVEAAKQQTEFVRKTILEDVGGVVLIHDWFKDALLTRLGVVHWGREETIRHRYESYTGLTEQGVAAVLMDDDAVLLERSDSQEQMPDGSMVTLSDVRIKRTERKKKLQITVVPPEEFMIARRARDIESSPFVGHRVRKTRSDLVAMGYTDDDLADIAFDEGDNASKEDFSRDVNRYSSDFREEAAEGGQERVWYYTTYIRADVDGDGIDEILCCEYAGKQLLRVDVAEEIPYAAITPVRMPHRFHGLSYADLVEDIQRIKTVLQRQALDNLYLANKPMREAVEGQVNMADLQKARVGGVVRVKAPGMIRELITTPMTASALQMIERMDQVRTERTGISAGGQALDPGQISANTPVGTMAQSISQMMVRVELIARMFAETGVRTLFKGIYTYLCRNPDVPRMVRLRNQWTEVDPRGWRDRENVTVTVGLGVGSRQAQQATLQQVFGMLSQAAATGAPFVSPANLYHAASKVIEAAGFKDIPNWLTDPSTIPPPGPPPPPEAIVIAQMQMQLEQAKLQQRDAEQQRDLALEQMKLQQQDAEQQRRAQIDAQRLQVDAMKATADAEERREARESAERIKYDEMLHDAVLQREKAQISVEESRRQAALDEAAMKALGDGPAEQPEIEEAEPVNGDPA